MFKPTLKRAQISERSIFQSSTQATSNASFVIDKTQLMSRTFNTDQFLPALFSKSIIPPPSRKQKRLVSPFSYWDLEYPAQVKQKLNLPINLLQSRLVGSKYGIFWLVTEKEMQIWRYQSQLNPTTLAMHRKFQFEKNIRAVALGHLDRQECSLINLKDNCEVMAVGFEHIIDLYTIDLTTLEISIMNTRLKVQNNEILQKMEITDKNQLLYTGDQGYLTKVSFNTKNRFGSATVNKFHARPSILSAQSIFPSFKLTKTKTKVYTETILTTNRDKIYVLIRKQSEGSFLQRLGLKILRFLSGKITVNEHTTIIQKQIHVYSITDKSSGQIKFDGVIRNSQIEQKIKQSYSAEEIKYQVPKNEQQLKRFQNSSIVNIFVHKTKRLSQLEVEKLGVATNYGLFLIINDNVHEGMRDSNFSFDEQPKHLPEELFEKNYKKASTSLFLRNNPQITYIEDQQANQSVLKNVDESKQIFDPLAEAQSKLIYCLGPNNFSLLNNGLCFYFDDKEIQLLKLNKQPGHIYSSSHRSSNTKLVNHPTWLVFSKTEITLIKKSQPYEHILTVLDSINQLEKTGITKGQKSEDYKICLNNAMSDMQTVLGNGQMCEALFKILFAIAKQKTGLPTQVSSKGEKLFRVSTEAKEAATQQLKFQIKASNRMKYYAFTEEEPKSYFTRWQVPKRKEVKPEIIALSNELEIIIWKYLMVYSVNSKQGNSIDVTVFNTPEVKTVYSLSVFQMYLISLFNYHYSLVKNMSLTELRKNPWKIKEVKVFFNALQTFLSQKKIKSFSLIPRSDALLDEQTQKQLSTRSQRNDANSYIWMQSSLPINILQKGLYLKSPSQEISTQMRKVIPRIYSTLELYELIAASSQRKYEEIPTIDKFMEMTSAKKQVKAALLDIYNSTDISSNEAITKFCKELPELRLDSDIYLARWLKYIGKGETAKQFDNKFSIATQIRLCDLEELSKKVDIDQTLKIKDLFTQNQPLYLKVLITQLDLRKLQYSLVDQMLKSRSQPWQQNQMETEVIHTSNLESSMFKKDKELHNLEKKGWLNSQIISIKNQLKSCLQTLALATSQSSSIDYLAQEKKFDDCVNVVLEHCKEGKQLINAVMDYLKKNSLLPEKLYRLSVSMNKPTSITLNLLSNPKNAQIMSSSTLIANNLRKTKQQIFSALNVTALDNSKGPSSGTTI